MVTVLTNTNQCGNSTDKLTSVLTIQKDTCQYGSSAYKYMPVWHQLRQIFANVLSVTILTVLTYTCQCGNIAVICLPVLLQCRQTLVNVETLLSYACKCWYSIDTHVDVVTSLPYACQCCYSIDRHLPMWLQY